MSELYTANAADIIWKVLYCAGQSFQTLFLGLESDYPQVCLLKLTSMSQQLLQSRLDLGAAPV